MSAQAPRNALWSIPPEQPKYNPPPPANPVQSGGGGCGFDWGQIQYEEFSSENPVYGLSGVDGSWPVVLSRPPRTGFFWVVLAQSWSANGGGVASYGLFLVPPIGNAPDKIQFLSKDGITLKFRSIPKFGVRVRGGTGFTAATGQSNGFQHFGEFTPAMLIIPPGWALMVAGDEARNGPGPNSSVLLQLAYAELPIGSDSPGFGG